MHLGISIYSIYSTYSFAENRFGSSLPPQEDILSVKTLANRTLLEPIPINSVLINMLVVYH